jgi:hypothetical protein
LLWGSSRRCLFNGGGLMLFGLSWRKLLQFSIRLFYLSEKSTKRWLRRGRSVSRDSTKSSTPRESKEVTWDSTGATQRGVFFSKASLARASPRDACRAATVSPVAGCILEPRFGLGVKVIAVQHQAVLPVRKVDEALAPKGSKCVGALDEVIKSTGVEGSNTRKPSACWESNNVALESLHLCRESKNLDAEVESP